MLQPPTPNQQMKTKKTFRVRKGAVYPWTSPSPQHLKQLKPAPKASLELIPMQLKQKWTLIVPSVKMTEWHISSSLINYQRNYCSFFFYYFWHFFVMSWKDFLLRYLPILLDFSELFCLLALQKWIFISNSRHIKYRLKNHNIARETRTQPKIGWMMIKKFCEKLSVYTRVKRKKSLLEKINENRYQSYTKSNHIKILELPQKTKLPVRRCRLRGEFCSPPFLLTHPVWTCILHSIHSNQ